MGWLFPHECITKQSLVDLVIGNWKTAGYDIQATKKVGKGLWILGTPAMSSYPIIAFYLMERQQGTWGYKDMDESMHPYYYDCPMDWLEKAPVVSQPWRDGVHAHHKKKLELATKKILANATYKVGGSWRFGGMPCTSVHVTSLKPFRGLCNGWVVRIPRKMRAVMEPV